MARKSLGVQLPESCNGKRVELGILAPAAQAVLWKMVANEVGKDAFGARTIDANKTIVAVDQEVFDAVGEATDWNFRTNEIDLASSRVVVAPRAKEYKPIFKMSVPPQSIFHQIASHEATVAELQAETQSIFEGISATGGNCIYGNALDQPPVFVCLNHSSEFLGRGSAFWILSFFYTVISVDMASQLAEITVMTDFNIKYNSIDRVPDYGEYQPINFSQPEERQSIRFVVEAFGNSLRDSYTEISMRQ